MSSTVPKFFAQSQTVQNNGSATFDLSSLGPSFTYMYGISATDWSFDDQLITFGVNLSASQSGSSVTVEVSLQGEILNGTTASTTVTLLATSVADGSLTLCVQNQAPVFSSSPPQLPVPINAYQTAAVLSGFYLAASDSSVCAGIGASAGTAYVVESTGSSALQVVNWGMLLPRSATFTTASSTITAGLIACATPPSQLGLSLETVSANLAPNASSSISVAIPGAANFASPEIYAFLTGFAGESSAPGNVAVCYGLTTGIADLAISGGTATGTLTFSMLSGTNSFGSPGVSYVLVCFDGAQMVSLDS